MSSDPNEGSSSQDVLFFNVEEKPLYVLEDDLICPGCDQPISELTEVDSSVRVNPAEVTYGEFGVSLLVSQGSCTHETLRWETVCCGIAVTVPDAVEITWG